MFTNMVICLLLGFQFLQLHLGQNLYIEQCLNADYLKKISKFMGKNYGDFIKETNVMLAADFGLQDDVRVPPQLAFSDLSI